MREIGGFSSIETAYGQKSGRSPFVSTHMRGGKLAARESECLTLLFLFQCEGIDIVRPHVANQHRRVCRIKAHPKSERTCVIESLQIDNAFRIAPR